MLQHAVAKASATGDAAYMHMRYCESRYSPADGQASSQTLTSRIHQQLPSPDFAG